MLIMLVLLMTWSCLVPTWGNLQQLADTNEWRGIDVAVRVSGTVALVNTVQQRDDELMVVQPAV
jgi:hypothetical protein